MIEKELKSILEDLIRFETVHSRMDEIEKCTQYIENFLTGYGILYKKIINKGYPSILVTPEPDKAEILLMSHIDVVDGESEMFSPYIKGDNLFGRGSIDDKYAVALSLLLCKKFYCKIDHAKLPFGILITSDEEIGGENCAGNIIKDIEAEIFIVLDGGNPDKIVVKEKGLLKIKLTSKGKSAHGSRPWLGENAIDNLISDYNNLKKLFLAEKENHWNRTINFGIVNAGISHNQVPKKAVGIFDVRYTEDDDPDKLIEDMKSAVKGEFEILSKGAVFTCPDNKYLDALVEISGAEKGSEHGASDARFISGSGKKGLVWGAEGNKSQHSENEHVYLPSIRKLYKQLDIFIQKFMK